MTKWKFIFQTFVKKPVIYILVVYYHLFAGNNWKSTWYLFVLIGMASWSDKKSIQYDDI